MSGTWLPLLFFCRKRKKGYLPWMILKQCSNTIYEDYKTHNGGWNKHCCIKAQPGKVDANFLPEVLPENPMRLPAIIIIIISRFSDYKSCLHELSNKTFSVFATKQECICIQTECY